MLLRIALLFEFTVRFAGCRIETPRCGYESCLDAQPGILNIHIVAHTHNDVGWLETVDGYYRDTVRQILNSVIEGLYGYPHRRFIMVETAFFWKWWLETDRDTRSKVHQLVQSGQLMFAGGAWSMNDEAATHYQSIIDQFSWGLEKLLGTFGDCGMPRVGWQIDPFGHSREFASLLAAMGYDGVFMGRIDYQDHWNRKAKLSMEMLWRGDDDLGNASDIFASVLYDLYVWPPFLCLDLIHCKESALNRRDDQRVSEFIEYASDVSRTYATNNILITFGNDFAYSDAPANFQNIDNLINFTNWKAADERLNIKAFYSTPTCYLKAVKDAKPVLPVKQDDFFPYASNDFNDWTGYYTSRPTTKYFERLSNNILQVAKQLQVLAGLEDHTIFAINKLKSAMGVMQHHDAITGTERQHVADDYVQMLDRAVDMALLIPQKAINKMLFGNEDAQALVFKRCQFNESRCEVSERSRQFIVAVYNPLAWQVKEPIRIPVTEGKYKVFAPNGKSIGSQVVEIPQHVLSMPTRVSAATHDVFFIANLKPLMLKTYYVVKKKLVHAKGKIKSYSNANSSTRQSKKLEALPGVIENEHMMLSVNFNTSEITHIRLTDGTKTKLNIKFCYYRSSGGAYIFRPMGNMPYDIETKIIPGSTGPIVKEIKIISDTASSVIRIYKQLEYIENEWLIGPIDVEGVEGKEYIVRYVTDIVNNAQFYTDSNGRQMLKRILNMRPQWDLNVQDSIAGNYYPVTNKIFIEDDKKRVAVLTDRSEGGSSLEEGHIELMLHRRLLEDDGLGLYEALNEIVDETGLVVSGKHRILITRRSLKDKVEERKQTFQMHLKPLILIANAFTLQTLDGPEPFDKWMYLKKHMNFAYKLPDGIHLLTLEPWENTKFLLRLENFFEKSDAEITKVQVNLDKIFKYLEVVSFTEMNLAGHESINKRSNWTWKTNDSFVENFNKAYGSDKTVKLAKDVTNQVYDHSSNVVLSAKQIRTFVVTYKMRIN